MKNLLFVKILVFLLILTGSNWNISAQDKAFNRKNVVIQLGVGIGMYDSNNSYLTSIPVIGSFEIGIINLLEDKATIGVGGYLAYSYGYNYYSNGQKCRDDDTFLAHRATFHYKLVDKLDTYAGVMPGIRLSKAYDSIGLGFTFPIFIGARYYFTQKIGAFAEFEYGVSNKDTIVTGLSPLEIGVAFKF